MLKLYNSLTNQKEVLKPIHKDKATIYSCGPTVYDHPTIGNLRAFLLPDLLQRVLRHVEGLSADWVMNITDVDDKLIARVARDYTDKPPMEGLHELAAKYTQVFLSDIAKVGINRADITTLPKATDHIVEMQQLILKLKGDGLAYISDDSIYFSVERYRSSGHQYGCLVSLDFSAQARVTDDQDQKEGVADFALWKAEKPHEPAWDFEIEGTNYRGRPGWHIECSAMSTQYLGQPFDIHTGGVDLKFPHHENELAQCGGTQAKIYLHNEFVNVEGAKMAKSAGNFLTIEDIPDPLAYRYFVLNAHYRKQVELSTHALKQSQTRLQALRNYVQRNLAAIELGIAQTNNELALKEFKLQVVESLQDDLNSPQALAAFSKLEAVPLLKGAVEVIAWADTIFGLDLVQQSSPFTKIEKATFESRKQARDSKDFDTADQLREQLLDQGIDTEDMGPQTVYWRVVK